MSDTPDIPGNQEPPEEFRLDAEPKPEPPDFTGLEGSVRVTGYSGRRTVQIVRTMLIELARECIGLLPAVYRQNTVNILNEWNDHKVVTRTNYDVLSRNLSTIRDNTAINTELAAKLDEAAREHERMKAFIEVQLAAFDAEQRAGDVRYVDDDAF